MGYFDDLQDSSASEQPQKSGGYFSDLKEQPSKLLSALNAPIHGIAEGAESFRGLSPATITAPIPKEYGMKLLEQFLPTREEHKPIKRAAKIATQGIIAPEAIPLLAAQTVGGTAAGELAEKLGLGEIGQNISEAVGMGVPGLVKGAGKLAKSLIKGESEKLPSGLTKIKAIESPTKFAKITEQRRASVIKNLDKEASLLAKKSLEKNVPIAKKIEQGFDFEKNFERNFGNLKQAAKKYNPDIDTSNLSKFLGESGSKYRGIPNPHPEAIKVMKEIKSFQRNPQYGLNNLLKIYRSNNQKLKGLYETRMAKGSQTEYADFLRGMNREISKSFENTLPEDSQWMKGFRDMNREFKSFKDAQRVNQQLKGILSETPKFSEIEKLATDLKTQDKLRMSMGDEGADEIVQIAKDLRLSKSVLRDMKKGEFSKFDLAFPLYYLIPGFGKGAAALHGIKLSKNFYGWVLSEPSRRKSYQSALESFKNKDLNGYKVASSKLLQELEEEKD